MVLMWQTSNGYACVVWLRICRSVWFRLCTSDDRDSRMLRAAWDAPEDSRSREDGRRKETNLCDSGSEGLMKVSREVVGECRYPWEIRLFMAAWVTPEVSSRSEDGEREPYLYDSG